MDDGREPVLGISDVRFTCMWRNVTSRSQSSQKNTWTGWVLNVTYQWHYITQHYKNCSLSFQITFRVKVGKCSPMHLTQQLFIKYFSLQVKGQCPEILKLTCMCCWGHTYTVDEVFATNICNVPVLQWSASYKNKWLSIVHLFPLASILLNSSLDVKNPLMSWQNSWYAPLPFRGLAACCIAVVKWCTYC